MTASRPCQLGSYCHPARSPGWQPSWLRFLVALLQEEPDQYHLKEGNVLKAESVLRQLAPPDEWCDSQQRQA